jgi:hypothetical protein
MAPGTDSVATSVGEGFWVLFLGIGMVCHPFDCAATRVYEFVVQGRDFVSKVVTGLWLNDFPHTALLPQNFS